MKQKVKLNIAQRSHLGRVFNDQFRNHTFYANLGPTMKAHYQEAVKAHFVPARSADLPGYEVDVSEKKDDEGNLVDTLYEIKVTLNFNEINEGTKIVLTKTFHKSAIDNVV